VIVKKDITEQDLIEFCKDHYYCDEDEGVREKWQPFEDDDDSTIESHIENDVYALKEFLGLTHRGKEVKREHFDITSISREDIAGELGEDIAKSFTDSEMERLASKMADDYLNQMYWESMKTLVQDIIDRRD